MTDGSVRCRSHTRRKRGTSIAVQASVCQRMEISIVVSSAKSVTSLMRNPRSCFRSTFVVVGDCQSLGKSWARAKIRWRGSSGSTRRTDRLGRCTFSRSRSFDLGQLLFQSCSRLLATSRFSRINRFEAVLGQIGFVPHSLPSQLPLPVDSLRSLGQMIEGRHRHLQLSRLHGFEEGPCHRRVDMIAPEGLAARHCETVVELRAGVDQITAIAVANRHASRPATASGNPLEQSRTFARGTPSIRVREAAVLVESFLISLELLDRDVGGMMIGNHDRPIVGFDCPTARFGFESPFDEVSSHCLRASINIRAGVGWVMQHPNGPRVRAQGPPDHLTLIGTEPDSSGKP